MAASGGIIRQEECEVRSPLTASIRQAPGGVTVVDLAGRITLGQGAAVLRETLQDLVAGGRVCILLNLCGVPYIDSSGIAEMVAGYTAASSQGGSVRVLIQAGPVRQVVGISVFEIFDNENEAIDSFRRGSAAVA
jgi:anti-sigma B factor antagonist